MSRYIDAEKTYNFYMIDEMTDEYYIKSMTIDEALSHCDEVIPAADVVEADKAQKEIDYWHDKAQSYEQTILKLALNKADVVEVVRCKDCKWYRGIGCAIKIVDESDEPTDNDFCSYGERADT